VYDGDNFTKIQDALGERPGGYTIDKFYMKKGWNNKPYFWDANEQKWKLVKLGDMFQVVDGEYPLKIG
jgi:hypothetical protein